MRFPSFRQLGKILTHLSNKVQPKAGLCVIFVLFSDLVDGLVVAVIDAVAALTGETFAMVCAQRAAYQPGGGAGRT